MARLEDNDTIDNYLVIDSDDEECCDSSDDETRVILHGTPQQKQRLYRRSLGHDSSTEDEFEKEMDAELDQTIESLNAKYSGHPSNLSQPQTKASLIQGEKKCYAQEYFDSSSDEEMSSREKAKTEHAVISNDDLFYDPDMDDDDQQWVDDHRRRCQPSVAMLGSGAGKKKKTQAASKLPNSDAVLNCPACMTLLCRDCQRHSVYTNQYRAMFISNCSVDTTQTLKYPMKGEVKSKKSKKSKKQKKCSVENDSKNITSYLENSDKVNRTEDDVTTAESGDSTSGLNTVAMGTRTVSNDCAFEAYNSVKCVECSTTVGVIDKDEIVHFFNVLASY